MSCPATVPSLVFRGHKQVALEDWPFPQEPLAADEFVGRTIVSVVSPGTELNWVFHRQGQDPQPTFAGYAVAVEITAVGSGVTSLHPGQRVFGMGPHRAMQRGRERDFVPIPEGLRPEDAVLARLLGVSWTTLTTTRARPADRVLVYGLGIIGNMAAQLFAAAGYQVTALDVDSGRCAIAKGVGLKDVRQRLTPDDTDIYGTATLAIDCTGHEQAVVDACQAVRKGGEVVLVGVPWAQRCQANAFAICHAVFHRYVTLRSGWEWELPVHDQDFARGNIHGNFAAALQWLKEGRICTTALAPLASPADACDVYQALGQQKWNGLTAVFDWRSQNPERRT